MWSLVSDCNFCFSICQTRDKRATRTEKTGLMPEDVSSTNPVQMMQHQTLTL